MGRPCFWPVSLLPYYLGFVLATHRLVPSWAQFPAVAAGAVVIGPLLWLSVLAVNDAHDLHGDRLNPRKAGTPLTSGRMSVTTARQIAGVAGLTAVAVATTVGLAFAAGTLLAVVVGWLYSAPPARLKARAGADVAVNAIALGVLGPVAGWIVVRPVAGFPWVVAALGVLVGAALYLPTTLADLRADRASGYATIAVRLGPSRTRRWGMAAWTAAAALSIVLAAADEVIPRRMLVLELVMAPVLVAAYPRLARTERSFRGVVVLASLFLIPSVTFALSYTGVW